MKAIRWLLKLMLVMMTLPLILAVWLAKWFVVFLHHCSAWVFYLLGSVLLATAVLSYLLQQSQGMEALQMLIGGFVIFMIPQVVGVVVVLLELAAIHHVAIIVSDYEKARDFYVNKLGFAVVRENFRKERNDWKLDLRVGDGADAIELEIFAEPNPPKRVNRPEACGLRHLAFRVEDVEAAVAELAQMGIECEPIRLDSYTKKKMTFFFDPDGLPLELHE